MPVLIHCSIFMMCNLISKKELTLFEKLMAFILMFIQQLGALHEIINVCFGGINSVIRNMWFLDIPVITGQSFLIGGWTLKKKPA